MGFIDLIFYNSFFLLVFFIQDFYRYVSCSFAPWGPRGPGEAAGVPWGPGEAAGAPWGPGEAAGAPWAPGEAAGRPSRRNEEKIQRAQRVEFFLSQSRPK